METGERLQLCGELSCSGRDDHINEDLSDIFSTFVNLLLYVHTVCHYMSLSVTDLRDGLLDALASDYRTSLSTIYKLVTLVLFKTTRVFCVKHKTFCHRQPKRLVVFIATSKLCSSVS